MQGRVHDLAIIGGGINGTAIARDAAGRGLSVYLCEEDDLGGGASSESDKVVHGGLRLIQGLQISAMREAVAERQILMRAAPHLMRAVRFHIPHHARQMSPAALRLGLFALDHAAHHTLPLAGRVAIDDGSGFQLQPHFQLAFAYGDCVADDARLVILNALDARQRGAVINARTRCIVAEREGARWHLSLESMATGERSTVVAKVLVNAGGPLAGEVSSHVIQSGSPPRFDLHKRVSIVIRRPHDGRIAYALPNADGRIVTVAPFRPGLMVVGTAVSRFTGAPGAAAVERGDLVYLADVVAQYFQSPIRLPDIVATFLSLCALPAESGAVVRGRALTVDAPPRVAPAITVHGGELAVHRRFAEQTVDRIGKFLPVKPGWTAKAVLPGGGFPGDGVADLVRALRAAYSFVPEPHARRLVQAYGTRATAILTGCRRPEDLGPRFGEDLTGAEVRFLHQEEWATTADDVLWRRSKLGYTMPPEDRDRLVQFIAGLTEATAAVPEPTDTGEVLAY